MLETNLVILGFLLWVMVFPVISPFMEELMPEIWQCSYRSLTGNPCPFCGLTGDMRKYISGVEFEPECPLFPLLFTALIAEIPVRLFFTVLSLKNRSKKLVLWDIALHSAGLALYCSQNDILLSLLF
ncbi:hypothetical protein CSA37_10965 [Candidatus Fermentibacteria bacterium]|nr:MAG: hypothetical protein CSA37_10965 [Candidatus Fermentibacteria bacterium]